jgi:RNA exonuclease 4
VLFRSHALHEPVDGNKVKSNNEPTTTVVMIPRNLPPRDAKKFRKDARRKARSEGYSEDSIVFVVEGELSHDNKGGRGPTSSSSSSSNATELSSSSDTRGKRDNDGHHQDREKDGTKKKDIRKSYPRINDILIQHAADIKLKERLAKQRSANDALTASERSKYVAVDCEMVGIGPDGKKSALARVSVVDWECNVLLDAYVRVPERVTDFRTRVSGVRPRDISASNASAMDHDEARIAVGNLLLGKILVGHALKNDLSALMLSHPRDEIRDTARYAPFMRPSGSGGGKLRPRKLRDLVYENLGRRIQVEGESHCSVDDARATMELFQLVRGRWEKELQQKSSSGGKRGR